MRISFSDGGGRQADRGGAIAEIAGKPFGAALLWLLGIALAGMALWRLSGAAFGQAGPDGKKATKRAMAAVRSVFYGFVSYSVLSYAAGDKSSGSGNSTRAPVTSRRRFWTGRQASGSSPWPAPRWPQPVYGSR